MKHFLPIVILATALTNAAAAHDFGFAGILSSSNKEDLPELTLSVGKPIAEAPLVLKSGTAYEIEITSDGTGELALEGPGFFRAIWINEIVINGLEIRPYGIDSVEFDEAGTMEIEFVAIKPGRYVLKQPGSEGDSQKVDITIE
ncbi:hypothetical protein QO034_00660 [Sedimentitalea sp. JM2-8]|uniref:Copper-binding protein n=1 Tax=Sedimentitalea xiamensis TaxID=3050037 RepID=A0ABT7F933_9RHOB|nr:hypothetical protein [Sedimentitalea xiamensis]MDK3071607.1 hypothetical protein [Sedimentitalea xiamensis]